MSLDLGGRLGLWRSLLTYYGQPWRLLALRRFYRTLVAPGDLAFDIGAHVGNRSLALASAGARVVALEPQPRFAAFLERHVSRETILVLPLAVGAAPGEAVLNVSRRHPTVSSLSQGWIERVKGTGGFETVSWGEKVPVEVTTLDALVAAHGSPAFCKIDVEGLEAEILQGLSRPLPLVAFEYLPACLDVALACIARLESLGPYRFNLVSGETHRFRERDWLSADALRRLLPSCAADGRSGDIYARLG